MFRISKSDEDVITTLVIDGQLCGDEVLTVEFCCLQELSLGKPVRLVLRDLTNIDEVGKALLRRMAMHGVNLVAHGVYTSYVVEKLIDSLKPSLALNGSKAIGPNER